MVRGFRCRISKIRNVVAKSGNLGYDLVFMPAIFNKMGNRGKNHDNKVQGKSSISGRKIMIIDFGGTSRVNRASTSYMQSAGCGGPSSCLLRQSHTIFLVRIHRLSTKIFSFNSFESLRVLNSVLVVNAY